MVICKAMFFFKKTARPFEVNFDLGLNYTAALMASQSSSAFKRPTASHLLVYVKILKSRNKNLKWELQENSNFKTN